MTLSRSAILSAAQRIFIFLASLSCHIVVAQQDTLPPRADTPRVGPKSYAPSFYPNDRYGDPFSNRTTRSPLFLKNPKNLTLDVELDTGMNYTIRERMGSIDFRPPSSMSFSEFDRYQTRQIKKQYWQEQSRSLDETTPTASRGLIPKIYVGPVLDRLFGGSYIELIPRGFVTLDLGGSWQRIENPSIPIRQQRNGGFEFDQQINLNVTGKVGEKLAITSNFDNNNSFDFQNNLKVEYTGFKEEVIKKIEIGNVSFPLNNTLLTGAQNLFGFKAQLQFGKLFFTTTATSQRGKVSSIDVNSGGEQGRPFEIVGSNYDENKHFFLGQFFRDNYEPWLSALPQITSGLYITRVEVYILNRQNDTQTLRNVVGLMDMGEGSKRYRKDILTSGVADDSPTYNEANNLFDLLRTVSADASGINAALQGLGFENGIDFEKVTSARKLLSTEFSVNRELGYITLQQRLQNDEVLAVAFEYTYNGSRYKVGELTEDYSAKAPEEVIYLKLLRPRKISIKDAQGQIIPTWNLMMKNIYNLNVSQLEQEGFELRVVYRDDRTGIDNPQLQDGDFARTQQLIEVFGLDRLNPNNDPQPDGNFDFVENITVNTETGLIIFPFLHPFEDALEKLFVQESNVNTRNFLRQKYIYDTLYRTTKAEAELVTTKNKFYLIGSFRAGSGQEIIIQGFNITPGSVRVYAGELVLQEGVDYSVDYNFGKVTILNEGILSSGKRIRVTYEQQDPFAFQTRTLLGGRFDYRFNDDVNLGATFLYYNEQPLISRNLIGSEPTRNFKYGLDFNFKKDSRVLTKIVDKLPFLQTKAPSTIEFNTEFAQLVPGTSNLVNGEGTSFIDDFENSATPYSLLSPIRWRLASTPKTADYRYDPSRGAVNDLAAGYKRAKIAWYQIDNQFYVEGLNSFKPDNISDEDLRNHYMRAVPPVEIFPFFDAFVGSFNEPILNVVYYPSERGPYNYNPDLNPDGSLKDPATNWGGITTAIRAEVDFDKANIEYLEFWLMDPFINSSNGRIIDSNGASEPNTTGGELHFDLGSISEDLMRDGEHAFENGLPTDGNLTGNQVQENQWGYVTKQQYLNNAFDNSEVSRENQDVGLDGIGNTQEAEKFDDFIDQLDPNARSLVLQDPSADDFSYFLSDDLDARNAKILERYKNINGMDRNTPILSTNEPFARSGSNVPDNEDLNIDNTLSDLEEYYTYRMSLTPNSLRVGAKYVVDQVTNEVNGDRVTWYLLRIPVRQFDERVGQINGFKSIRYARMYLTGFTQPVALRMAKFRLVASRWRRYTNDLEESRFGELLEPSLDNFSVSVVNVEENGQGNSEKPAYVPPLQRDRDITSTVQRRLNEQAVQLCVTELSDGDARAIFKNVSVDLFNYGRIKMFFSAHGQDLADGDVVGFLRMGTDFDENYYEIELPLKVTAAGAVTLDEVWPQDNQIDLALDDLYALKAQRDREGFPLTEAFPRGGAKQAGRHGIRIYGRPDLSQVKSLMIGVRNPRSDDAKPLSVCLWANELRLTDFDRTSGWAVKASLRTQLADLGSVTGSFKHTSFGYGGVQSRIAERERSATTLFDISANLDMGKLLPAKAGLKIPVFFSWETTEINPNYDPANPDLRIQAALSSFNTEAEKDEYLVRIRDRLTRRSFNVTNLRKVKVKPDAKKHIYDIENFSFTYAYSESRQTNFNLLEHTQRSMRGAVSWQYAFSSNGFAPFAKMKALSSPYLRLIRDFNINFLPSTISVQATLYRSFRKKIYRNAVGDQLGSIPNYEKFFVFDRLYNLQWKLTKNLTFTYSSTVNTIIDEPDGDINTRAKRNVVLDNLKNFGRIKRFDQRVTFNYNVPLDKLPLTDWLRAEYRYDVGYIWTAAPLERDSTLQLGNTISNKRNQSLAGKLDLIKLYNKVGALKEINTPKQPSSSSDQEISSTPNLVRGLARLLMSVRSISGSYNLLEGTLLPGFTPSPRFFGLDPTWAAPGWRFVLGGQDKNFRFMARDNDWLTQNERLSNLYKQTRSEEINLNAAIEPFRDMKIQLNAKKTSTTSFQEIFRFDGQANSFVSLSANRGGSYKVSMLAIGTAFANNNSLNSDVFARFENNLEILRARFRGLTNREYKARSQDVLIPAFIASYTGADVNSVDLSPFPRIPIPGWQINYAGLGRIPALAEIFQNITLNHAYTSTYSVINYTNSLEYSNVGLDVPLRNYNNGLFSSVANASGDLIPIYVINQVTLSEAFAPLIGINVRTKKRLTLQLEYKTTRNLALNISNAQITEVNSKTWSFEASYTKKNLKLPWRRRSGKTITLKNDLAFRINMGLTNNQTIQRKIEDIHTVTGGNINLRLRPSINYVIGGQLSVQLYADHNANEPLVTNSYKRSTTRVGFKILFNLSQ